jgi:spore germination cell wall hydrolase CwlJ-like protein
MMSHDPVSVLALTIDGEAEGAGREGMAAVASVVLNRARLGGWWGNDIVSVCLCPYQFSCWLPGPDRDRIEALSGNDPHFQVALGVAYDAVTGRLTDATGGADSYYADSMAEPPEWAANLTPTATIGGQRFFRTRTQA